MCVNRKKCRWNVGNSDNLRLNYLVREGRTIRKPVVVKGPPFSRAFFSSLFFVVVFTNTVHTVKKNSQDSRGVVIPLDVLLFFDDKLGRRDKAFLSLPILLSFPLLALSLLPLLRSPPPPPPLPLPGWCRNILSPPGNYSLLSAVQKWTLSDSPSRYKFCIWVFL